MNLPDILTRYFDAANRFNIDDASDCFASDAFVHDEKRNYIGQDAIRAWIEETTQKYHPKVEVARADVHGEQVHLRAKVSGDFPGSPIELEYDITLQGEKICKLAIR